MPFAPGLTVTQIGMALAHPERTPRLIVLGIGVIVMMVAIYPVNLNAARKLQQRIDGLNALSN